MYKRQGLSRTVKGEGQKPHGRHIWGPGAVALARARLEADDRQARIASPLGPAADIQSGARDARFFHSLNEQRGMKTGTGVDRYIATVFDTDGGKALTELLNRQEGAVGILQTASRQVHGTRDVTCLQINALTTTFKTAGLTRCLLYTSPSPRDV